MSTIYTLHISLYANIIHTIQGHGQNLLKVFHDTINRCCVNFAEKKHKRTKFLNNIIVKIWIPYELKGSMHKHANSS